MEALLDIAVEFSIFLMEIAWRIGTGRTCSYCYALCPDKLAGIFLEVTMTLNLELTPELEERVRDEASRYGLSINQYTLKLLKEHVPLLKRQQQVVDIVQSWIDQGDAEEQKETGEYLIRALDEDRLSDRKLFPTELKGVTW